MEFVYVFPVNTKDIRQWIGGIIRSDTVTPSKNLRSHPVSLTLSHKLSSMVTTAIKKGVDENPYLTTHQIACGQGIGFRPGSADMARASYERLNYQKKKH